jgi:periplasmic protein CpxP/Spy
MMFFEGTVTHTVLQGFERIARITPFARVRSTCVAVLLTLGLVLTSASTAVAQGGGRVGGDTSKMRERRVLTPQELEERRKFVADFEQRVEQVLFTRLQATEEQRTKMRTVKKRFDVDKNQLFKEEGELRRAMRTELTSTTPNDAKLSELLGKWPALQRRRIEIQEREQKELAKFLTPVQRARFFAFEDEFRRSKQEMQWGRGDRGGPPGMPGMRGENSGNRGDGNYRGGGGGGRGGRGGRPPVRDTIKQ